MGHQPLLTNAIRPAVNDLTERLNNAYRTTIASYPSDKVRFIDISPGFNGHRFCEQGSSKFNPYYSGDAWFWNLSPPIPDLANPFTTTPPSSIWDWASSVLGTLISGWTLRPFHPKFAGHIAIKDAIIAQMKLDGVPQSEPQCTDPKSGVNPSVAQAQNMNTHLDNQGANGGQCCSNSSGGCKTISSDGAVGVDLCSEGTTAQCIPCASAANYLAGMIGVCTQGGLVSAKQNINGQAGLSIQI